MLLCAVEEIKRDPVVIPGRRRQAGFSVLTDPEVPVVSPNVCQAQPRRGVPDVEAAAPFADIPRVVLRRDFIGQFDPAPVFPEGVGVQRDFAEIGIAGVLLYRDPFGIHTELRALPVIASENEIDAVVCPVKGPLVGNVVCLRRFCGGVEAFIRQRAVYSDRRFDAVLCIPDRTASEAVKYDCGTGIVRVFKMEWTAQRKPCRRNLVQGTGGVLPQKLD